MSLRDLAPGLYHDVPEAEYHQKELGVASKHGLDELARAPAAYWQWLHGPEPEDTKPFALGRAAHMAILEPERFRSTYVISPDFGPQRKTGDCSSERAKENKIRKQAWCAEHAGATILDSADALTTFGMVRALAEHPRAAALLEGCETEVTATWLDRASGVRCKARLDGYRRDLAAVVEIKTTADARPESFRRVAENCAYYRQEAMYLGGLAALLQPAEVFPVIAIEKPAPHLIRVYEFDEADLRRGREEVRDLLEQYAHCMHSGEWPGYPIAIERLRLRPWQRGVYE